MFHSECAGIRISASLTQILGRELLRTPWREVRLPEDDVLTAGVT